MSDERCGTCRFWDYYDGLGDCRRYPPTVNPKSPSTDPQEHRFPLTNLDNWCSEYQLAPDITYDDSTPPDAP